MLKLKKNKMVIGEIITVEECQRGYILKGVENHRGQIQNGKFERGYFIVFYDHLDGLDFQGAMITSTDYQNQNVALAKDHFYNENALGEPYLVNYKNSYLVKAKLHKFHQMGEFIFMGLLTAEGISFIEEVIDNFDLITWEQHRLNNN
jgi:hypothetical protein